MACLKVLVGCALFLAGSLGESWYGVLETLQNADYVLTFKTGGGGGIPHSTSGGKRGLFGSGAPTTAGVPPSRSTSLNASQSAGSLSSQGSRHPLLTDLEPETLVHAIQRLFDSSKNLEDNAFKAFVEALCKLSSEMIGMQSDTGMVSYSSSESLDDSSSNTLRVDTSDAKHRRRMSGIYIPKNQVRLELML